MAVDLWLGKYIKQDVLSLQRDPSALVGPGYVLALLFQKWKKTDHGTRELAP